MLLLRFCVMRRVMFWGVGDRLACIKSACETSCVHRCVDDLTSCFTTPLHCNMRELCDDVAPAGEFHITAPCQPLVA